jgi:hypothetical protein
MVLFENILAEEFFESPGERVGPGEGNLRVVDALLDGALLGVENGQLLLARAVVGGLLAVLLLRGGGSVAQGCVALLAAASGGGVGGDGLAGGKGAVRLDQDVVDAWHPHHAGPLRQSGAANHQGKDLQTKIWVYIF